jgi:uncharacterized protein YlxP (DUF503 family)
VIIGVARLVFHIPTSRSLKDKRQVVKPLLAMAQRELHLAVAEVEAQDKWQLAVLGIVCVANDAGHADRVLADAVHRVRGRAADAELVDYQTEIVHAL